VTVTVTPSAVITFFSATPSAITIGQVQQSTVLSWSSMHSTGCTLTTLTGPGTPGGTLSTVSGNSPVTLDFSLTPAGTYAYELTCLGTGGTIPASQSINVTVAPAPPPGTTNPSITQFLSLQPTIPLGQSSTLNWISANSTSCDLSAGGTLVPGAPHGISGSFSVSPTATTPYTLSCTGAAGTTPASQTTTITVVVPPVPAAIIRATPSTITSGQSTSITWSSSDSLSCEITGTGAPAAPLAISGAFTTPVLTVSTTYTVTCVGPGGNSPPQSALVTVNPVGGGGGPACESSTGAAGAITLSNTVSRLSGVAPLSVFFDASGTTATATTKPIHELEYRWTFGDTNLSPPVTVTNPAATGTSTWNTGSKPGASLRNKATGPVAAHVYETPGTYTVTLDVTDGTTNSVTNTCTQIVVQNPDDTPGAPGVFTGANTVCVAGWNSPAKTALSLIPIPGTGGCPAGADRVVQPNFTTAINTYAKTGKRVLFKRGDTFLSTPYSSNGNYFTSSITATGPGIVGAFGTGVPPVIQPNNPNGNDLLNISVRTTPNLKDWRVMDLELDGMSTGSGSRIYSSGVSFGGGANQITLLRLNIHDIYSTGIGNATNTLDHSNNTGYGGHKMWDQIAVVDSSVLRNHGDGSGNGGCGMYFAALRFSLLGTTVDDVTQAEHILRFPYLDKAVISNNILSRQAGNKHVIKLHAPIWNWPCGPGGSVQACATPVGDANDPDLIQYGGTSAVYDPANGATGYTEQIVISDNKIVNGSTASWAVSIGPRYTAGDERVRDVIAERNWFTGVAGARTQTMFVIQDSVASTTFRNNICDIAGASGEATCVLAGKGGVDSLGFTPDGVWVYNNTAYVANAVSRFSFFAGNFSNATNVMLKNNLSYAPLATNIFTVWGSCLTGVCEQSNNSTITPSGGQIKNTNPFTALSPLVPVDFTPAPTSYAIGTGTPVPVFSDFFKNPRSPSSMDMGAVKGI
jgi:hypothetical protein